MNEKTRLLRNEKKLSDGDGVCSVDAHFRFGVGTVTVT